MHRSAHRRPSAARRKELPAYVSNGVIGLRVREIPLAAGMALLSGYAGEHPERRIEAAAVAPYPLRRRPAAGRRLAVRRAPSGCEVVDQAYDFAMRRTDQPLRLHASASVAAQVEVLTFCSRDRADPGLPGDRHRRSTAPATCACAPMVDAAGHRRPRRCASCARRPARPSRPATAPCCGRAPAAFRTCGVAYVTELLRRGRSRPPERPPLAGAAWSANTAVRARPGRRYRCARSPAWCPSALHGQPDFAGRAAASPRPPDAASMPSAPANRACWAELWKGRIRLVGAGRALAGAGRRRLLLPDTLGARRARRPRPRSSASRPGTTITTTTAT